MTEGNKATIADAAGLIIMYKDTEERGWSRESITADELAVGLELDRVCLCTSSFLHSPFGVPEEYVVPHARTTWMIPVGLPAIFREHNIYVEHIKGIKEMPADYWVARIRFDVALDVLDKNSMQHVVPSMSEYMEENA